ncbi:vacuolar sorting protein VPS33/slp1 [Nowakowskiella sp. JEL0407]|nr:vacuolar sorting protein VPS33/slp1 [Nowakowskiella sp. JEL0407]
MLRRVQPPGRWKILVVDAEALKIINSACRMTDVLDENVTSVEDITRKRQPYPDKEAIYFIGPSMDSVQSVIDDFTKGKPLYSAAHIFCTGPLPDRLFDKIKRSPANNYTKTVTELNVDFIAHEPHVFSFDNPVAMHAIYNAPTPSHLDFELKNLAVRLTSVLAALGEYPYIRYHDPHAGHKGVPLTGKLARMLTTELDNLSEHDHSFPPRTSYQPATLILLDRSIDVISPLLHEHTYQAMGQDLIMFDNGKYTYQQGKEEVTSVLDESDVIWAHTRHWHIAEVMDFLGDVVQKFMSTNKAANWERSKGESDLSMDKLQQMKETMSALPQYQEMKKKFSLHTNLCQEIMAVYKRRQLERVAKLEQDMATELDSRQAKMVMFDLNPLLEDRNVRYLDKVRLLMLFIIAQEGIQEADRERLFETIRLGQEETQAVNNLSILGVRLGASMEKRRTERGRYTYGGGKQKEAKEPKFDTMRYTPVVQYVAEDQVKGVIDSAYFPWTNEPPSDYAGIGVSSKSNSRESEVIKSTKPSWATRKVNGGSSNPRDSASLSDSENNRSSMSLESLLTAMKGGNKTTDLRANGPRVIIFVLGGITYSEMRVCAEVMKSSSREVIIGSTHLCNPKDFLDILKTLHKGNAGGAASTTPTPRMPGSAVLTVLAPPPVQYSSSPSLAREPYQGDSRSQDSRSRDPRRELSKRDTPRERSDDTRDRSGRSPRSPRSERKEYFGDETSSRSGSSRAPRTLPEPPKENRDDRSNRYDKRDYRERDGGSSRYNDERERRYQGSRNGDRREEYDRRPRDDGKQSYSERRQYRDEGDYKNNDRDGRDNSRQRYEREDYEYGSYGKSGLESSVSKMRIDSGGPEPYYGNRPQMSDSKEMARKDNEPKTSWWKRK